MTLSLENTTATSSSAPSAQRWWASFILLGLLLFSVGDLGLRFLWHPDAFDTPYRSWIAAAVADYPRQGEKPQIIILGSSLMVAAVNDGDATTLGQTIDGTAHHRSVTLEQSLTAQDVAPSLAHTQSFAIGGQMASDAYAILRALFGRHTQESLAAFTQPKLIVWGIAPRDFLDATFLDPYSSTTVTYLDKVSPNDDALGTRKPYFWREMEHRIDNICYTYDQRDHLLLCQKQFTHELLARLGLVSRADLGTVKTPQELLRIARRELPEDNGIRQWMVNPQRQAIVSFEDNSKEYTARYNPYKEKLFNTQLDYLQKFLLLARGLGIKVVLVNMPLTPANLALIPPGRYQTYLHSVKNMAGEAQAEFVDFNDGKRFSHEYFNDPVHLNGYGSQRFFRMVGDHIAPQLKSDLVKK